MAKGGTIAGLTVTIGADTASFTKALRSLDNEAKALSKDLSTVNKNLKLDPKNADKAAQSLDLLKKSAQKAEEKIKLIKDSMNKLNDAYKKGDVSAEEYKKSLESLNLLYDQAKHEQDLYNEEIKQFGTETKDAGKGALSLADIIKGNLISKTILNGLSKLKDLAVTIAKKLWEAAKSIAQFSFQAVKSAAEYEDALGYAKTVYGDMADESIQWAKENSEGLRISTKQLTQYMNTLGQVFHTQGLGEEEALEMTETLMEMAADIRAATGMTTDEILPVMQRGFTTSVKNFRQFGVIMTDAEVKAYALAHGLATVTVNENDLAVATANLHDKQKKAEEALKKYGEESVEFEKAEANLIKAEEKYNEVLGGEVDTMNSATIIKARYLLLAERLKNIHGQNTNEAELFNSQLELMKVKFTNLRDEIGLKLLPVATDLVTKFNEFLSSERGQAITDAITDAFERLGKKIGEMLEDGTIENFINMVIDKAPEVIKTLGDLGEKIVELLPQLLEFITQVNETIEYFSGELSEEGKIQQAYKNAKESIEELAEAYDTDTETMRTAIAMFAEENGKSLEDIYSNWEEYEGDIRAWMEALDSDYKSNLAEGAFMTIQQFATDNGMELETIASNWDTYEAEIIGYAGDLKDGYDTEFAATLEEIKAFSKDNGVTLQEVLTNWTTYEPQVNKWLTQMSSDTSTMQSAVKDSLDKLEPDAQEAINKFASVDWTPFDSFRETVRSWAADIASAAQDAYNWLVNLLTANDGGSWQDNFELNPPVMSGGDPYANAIGFEAAGGPVRAGGLYRVNDDAGHRTEWFVPSQNGYILNGNQVDRIKNNVTNNNRNISGGINIYVNSYGMNVAEVAEELGAAMNNKLRMSGALL